MQRIDLVCIDFQADFMDNGSLPVKGGRQAAQNTAQLIKRLGKKISNVYASLDSHQNLQIFHALWFLNKQNQHPNPYTPITYAEVANGDWRATKRALQARTEEYLKELEAKGRYTHMIWPYHCRINTPGWLLEDELSSVLNDWEIDNLKRVNYVAKGNNPFTEFFSAFEAEVVQPDDPSTQLNTDLITSLEEADEIVWAGLAGSHCLKFSMKSVFDNFSNGDYLKKCVLLTDCTAPVGGFEQQQEDFIKEMTLRGMKTALSTDYLT